MINLDYSEQPKKNNEKLLKNLRKTFNKKAGKGNLINKSDFKNLFGIRNEYYASKIFELFDTDKSQFIDQEEFLDGVQTLILGDEESRLRFSFDIHDVDGNGSIDKEELKQILTASLHENQLELNSEEIERLTEALFDEADLDGSGDISFEEFKHTIRKYPLILQQLNLGALTGLFPSKESLFSRFWIGDFFLRSFLRPVHYLQNNWAKLLFICAYLSVNAILFWNDFQKTSNETINLYVRFARGSSACLNFNGALILLPVMRNTLTWIRKTFINNFIPVDKNIDFHKFIGQFMFIFSIIHVAGYLLYYSTLSVPFMDVLMGTKPALTLSMKSTMYEFVSEDESIEVVEQWIQEGAKHSTFETKILPILKEDCTSCHSQSSKKTDAIPRIPLTTYEEVKPWTYSGFTWSALSPQAKIHFNGFLLFINFLVLWVFAQNFVRKSGHYHLFYLSHLSFVAWFILTLIHGHIFWQWALIPCLGYVIDKAYGYYRKKSPSSINKIQLFPSDVIGLEIERPSSFSYRPGDYLFIRIPSISKFEWHPFTITSSPENRSNLSLHVKRRGNWTNSLHHLCSQLTPLAPNTDSKTQYKLSVEEKIPVFLNGPYGSPSVHIFESRYAILIGAGIGVTPFAAVLRTILDRFRQGEATNMKLEKVYFYWVSRRQDSFEWFSQLLAELETESKDDFLEIFIHMTGAKKDIKSGTLNIAMELHHQKTKVDLVTGLNSLTNLGHPDWDNIFQEIAKDQGRKKVDVYFCGPPAYSRKLKALSSKYRFSYRKENF